MVAWWVPAALAVLIVAGAGAWTLSQSCWGFDHCGGPAHPWNVGPEATLVVEEGPGGRSALRIGWRSPHEGVATQDDLLVLVDEVALPRVDGAPGEGSWSGWRDGRWLRGDETTRSNDLIVLGATSSLEGAVLGIGLEPCNCLMAPRFPLEHGTAGS